MNTTVYAYNLHGNWSYDSTLTDIKPVEETETGRVGLGLCNKAKRGKQSQSVLDSLPLLLNVVWPRSKTWNKQFSLTVCTSPSISLLTQHNLSICTFFIIKLVQRLCKGIWCRCSRLSTSSSVHHESIKSAYSIQWLLGHQIQQGNN